MNLEQYVMAASRTCPTLTTYKEDVAHMMLGIMSELVELEEAIEIGDIPNIGEELGDIMWYVANYSTIISIPITSYVEVDDSIDNLVRALYSTASRLSNIVKRFIAYNKQNLDEEMLELNNVKYLVYSIAKHYSLDINNILLTNITKLKNRFPDKFTEQFALSRDISAERKILEDGFNQGA